jgi:hypothetical protein
MVHGRYTGLSFFVLTKRYYAIALVHRFWTAIHFQPAICSGLPRPPGARFNSAMPALTRRRLKDAHAESWQIFYGDVQVGTIGIRAGVPTDVDQWG